MKIRLISNINHDDSGFVISVGGVKRRVNFGADIPAPGSGWVIARIFSFDGDLNILCLQRMDQTAFWFCDAQFHFIDNRTEEFLNSDALSGLLRRADAFDHDTDITAAISAIFDLIMEMVVTTTGMNQLQPDFHALRGAQPDISVSNIIRQLNTPPVVSGVFKELIVIESLIAGHIGAQNDKFGVLKFDRFLPIENFWYIGFASDASHDYVVFITRHAKAVVALFDIKSNIMWSDADLDSLGFNPIFYPYARFILFWLGGLLGQSAPPKYDEMGVMFRENHIGHYIWNELATIYNLNSLGKSVTAFLYSSCVEPGFSIEQIFPGMNGRVVRNAKNLDVILASVVAGVEFFPFMSFHIPERFARMLSDKAVECEFEFNRELSVARAGSFILLIGLRLENRKWIAQKEGYMALLDYLATLDADITVIFDGHNYQDADKQTFVRSHQEMHWGERDGIPEIVRLEIELVEEIFAYAKERSYEKLRLINLIPCSVSRSIVAALNCDYMITHWGAGLAKYKWVANADGCIIAPRSVMETKGDLRIYDTTEFREGATPLFFYPSELIKDVGNHGQLIAIDHWERHDFDLDKDIFAQSLGEVIHGKMIKRAFTN